MPMQKHIYVGPYVRCSNGLKDGAEELDTVGRLGLITNEALNSNVPMPPVFIAMREYPGMPEWGVEEMTRGEMAVDSGIDSLLTITGNFCRVFSREIKEIQGSYNCVEVEFGVVVGYW